MAIKLAKKHPELQVGRLWNEEKALTLIEDVLTYSLLKRSKIRE